MQDIKRKNKGAYIWVPDNFIRVIDAAKFYGGFKNRQDYLKILAENIKKNDNKVKNRMDNLERHKGGFLEFDW
jgi:hypothetical protein